MYVYTFGKWKERTDHGCMTVFVMLSFFHRLLKKLDYPDMEFSLYFLAYVDPASVPKDEKEATKFCFSTPATIELTQ